MIPGVVIEICRWILGAGLILASVAVVLFVLIVAVTFLVSFHRSIRSAERVSKLSRQERRRIIRDDRKKSTLGEIARAKQLAARRNGKKKP